MRHPRLCHALLGGLRIVRRLDFRRQQGLARILDDACFGFERGEAFREDGFGVRLELRRLPGKCGLRLGRTRILSSSLGLPRLLFERETMMRERGFRLGSERGRQPGA